jgi:hypothetical protein
LTRSIRRNGSSIRRPDSSGKPLPGGPPQFAEAGDPGWYNPSDYPYVIADYYLSEAGLLPPGYVLRSRSREERQIFTAHKKWTIDVLDGKEEVPSANTMTGWLDWELYLSKKVMIEEDCWHFGMPDEIGLLFKRLRDEENRRRVLAARRTSIYSDEE